MHTLIHTSNKVNTFLSLSLRPPMHIRSVMLIRWRWGDRTHNRILGFIPTTSHLTHVFSPPASNIIQRITPDTENLPHGLLRPHHYSCIHQCSPFIYYNYLSMLHRHSSFIQCSFNTVHPPRSWPSSQPRNFHIRFYYFLFQLVLLHSLHVSKPSQHTANSLITCFPSHPFIFHTVHTCYSTHTPQTPHLHYI